MYVPIMKARKEEMIILKDMNNFFSSDLIPLVEIIKDEYEPHYKVDPLTGKFIYIKEEGKKRRERVKLPQKEADIITLQKISEQLNEKKAFIDFFRFRENEYDNRTYKGMELALRLSRDFSYYKARLLNTGNFHGLIPVISIKKELSISSFDFTELIRGLKEKNEAIAIRITHDYLDEYMELLEENLTEEDYIMLDIRDNSIDSAFMEIDEFRDLESNAIKILLNSPRSRKNKNGDFENLQFTKKIINSVATEYKKYQLDGFGDFGGLKDDLPNDQSGGNGKGVALALIYMKSVNEFFSIVNLNTDDGVRGYKNVRTEILKSLPFLDSDNDCKAIMRIKEMRGKYGTWSTWNNIALTRYIQEQAKK